MRLISARNPLNPAFGGPTLRLLRKGAKYALDFTMPPMTYVDALAWSDLEAETDTVVMPVPQPGLVIGNPGAPRVNGAGQSGMNLQIDGVTPGYELRKGQLVSVSVDDQWFLYKARAAATATSGGILTIPLRTMLRRSPADNAVVEIADPKIEGFVTLGNGAGKVSVDHFMHGISGTIEERE